MDLGSINGIRVQRGADLLVREPAALQKTRLARPLLEVARRGGAELPAAHPLDLGQPVAGAGVDPAGHGLLGQALFLQLAPDAHGSVAPAAAAAHQRFGEALVREQPLLHARRQHLLHDLRLAALARELGRYLGPAVLAPGEPAEDEAARLGGIGRGRNASQASTSSGTDSGASSPAAGDSITFSRMRRSISSAVSG